MAISSGSILIVVRLGVETEASSVSSMPMTLTSRGTFTPRLAIWCSTPRATRSLWAITAVASWAATRVAACTPVSNRGSYGPSSDRERSSASKDSWMDFPRLSSARDALMKTQRR